jgi:hypothetical protein
MAHPPAGPVAVLAAASALLIGASTGCSKQEPGHRECSQHEPAEVAALAKLPILRLSPAATQADGAFSGCGLDDSGDPVEPHAGRR